MKTWTINVLIIVSFVSQGLKSEPLRHRTDDPSIPAVKRFDYPSFLRHSWNVFFPPKRVLRKKPDAREVFINSKNIFQYPGIGFGSETSRKQRRISSIFEFLKTKTRKDLNHHLSKRSVRARSISTPSTNGSRSSPTTTNLPSDIQRTTINEDVNNNYTQLETGLAAGIQNIGLSSNDNRYLSNLEDDRQDTLNSRNESRRVPSLDENRQASNLQGVSQQITNSRNSSSHLTNLDNAGQSLPNVEISNSQITNLDNSNNNNNINTDQHSGDLLNDNQSPTDLREDDQPEPNLASESQHNIISSSHTGNEGGRHSDNDGDNYDNDNLVSGTWMTSNPAYHRIQTSTIADRSLVLEINRPDTTTESNIPYSLDFTLDSTNDRHEAIGQGGYPEARLNNQPEDPNGAVRRVNQEAGEATEDQLPDNSMTGDIAGIASEENSVLDISIGNAQSPDQQNNSPIDGIGGAGMPLSGNLPLPDGHQENNAGQDGNETNIEISEVNNPSINQHRTNPKPQVDHIPDLGNSTMKMTTNESLDTNSTQSTILGVHNATFSSSSIQSNRSSISASSRFSSSSTVRTQTLSSSGITPSSSSPGQNGGTAVANTINPSYPINVRSDPLIMIPSTSSPVTDNELPDSTTAVDTGDNSLHHILSSNPENASQSAETSDVVISNSMTSNTLTSNGLTSNDATSNNVTSDPTQRSTQRTRLNTESPFVVVHPDRQIRHHGILVDRLPGNENGTTPPFSRLSGEPRSGDHSQAIPDPSSRSSSASIPRAAISMTTRSAEFALSTTPQTSGIVTEMETHSPARLSGNSTATNSEPPITTTAGRTTKSVSASTTAATVRRPKNNITATSPAQTLVASSETTSIQTTGSTNFLEPPAKTNPSQSTATITTASDSIPEKPSYIVELTLSMSWSEFCQQEVSIRGDLVDLLQSNGGHDEVTIDQIQVMNENEDQCLSMAVDTEEQIQVQLYLVDKNHLYDRDLTQLFASLVSPQSLSRVGDLFRQKLIAVHFRDKFVPTHKTGTSVEATDDDQDGGFFSDPGVTLALIIAGVGSVCCVALIVLQTMIRRRQRSSLRVNNNHSNSNNTVYHNTSNNNRSFSITSADSIQLYSVSKSNGGVINLGLNLMEPPDPTHPLNLAQLSEFCADDDKIFYEYRKLPNRLPRLSVVPTGEEEKNRYANILPLAHTRVKLSKEERRNSQSSYINANYVTGPNNECQYYIATQAPTTRTLHDFWTMVWQQEAKAIVMLTQLEEEGQCKSAAYWPELTGKSAAVRVGDFVIELKHKDVHQEYISSRLEVNNLRKIETRQIHHYWYTCWPSRGTPEPISLVKFVLDTRPRYENCGKPLIVHCSPGTGRTGTFIGLDLCMRQFESKRIVDVMKTIHDMRMERAGAVQNKEQYALLYNAVNEYASIVASPGVSVASSASTLHALLPD